MTSRMSTGPRGAHLPHRLEMSMDPDTAGEAEIHLGIRQEVMLEILILCTG